MEDLIKKICSKGFKQPKILANFKTANFKLRKEDFGGIVALKDNSRVFLDRNGYEILSQLLPSTEYALSNLQIDWRGLNSEQFISGLYSRKVLFSIKKGGDLE